MVNYKLLKGKNMTSDFKKLMSNQVQKILNKFMGLIKISVPRSGWIRTIRDTLGMSSYSLAKRLGCSRENIVALERREKNGTVTLKTLDEVAQAMNCKLVYCLLPMKPLDQILEEQAMLIAKKRISIVNHSMSLEQQGLTPQQLKQQEDDLVQELLQGKLGNLWKEDNEV